MIKIDKELDTMEENVLKMGQKVVRDVYKRQEWLFSVSL